MSILPSTKRFGNEGEGLVKKHLGERGFFIIESNFFSPFGEIDIIASKKKSLYFIEVKTRSETYAGMPEEFVSQQQLGRIKRMIEVFLMKHQKYCSYEKEIVIASVLKSNSEQQITFFPIEK